MSSSRRQKVLRGMLVKICAEREPAKRERDEYRGAFKSGIQRVRGRWFIFYTRCVYHRLKRVKISFKYAQTRVSNVLTRRVRIMRRVKRSRREGGGGRLNSRAEIAYAAD